MVRWSGITKVSSGPCTLPPRGNSDPHCGTTQAPNTKHPIKIWIRRGSSISWHHLLETSLSQNKHVSYTNPGVGFPFKGTAPVASRSSWLKRPTHKFQALPFTDSICCVEGLWIATAPLTTDLFCTQKGRPSGKMLSELKLYWSKAVEWLFQAPTCVEMEIRNAGADCGNIYTRPNLY